MGRPRNIAEKISKEIEYAREHGLTIQSPPSLMQAVSTTSTRMSSVFDLRLQEAATQHLPRNYTEPRRPFRILQTLGRPDAQGHMQRLRLELARTHAGASFAHADDSRLLQALAEAAATTDSITSIQAERDEIIRTVFGEEAMRNGGAIRVE